MIEQLRTRHAESRKAQDAVALRVLPMLIAALEEASRGKENFNDDMAIAVLTKKRAERLDSAEQFQKADRPDRVAEELAEAQFIKQFLPEQLDQTQVGIMIDKVGAELKAAGTVPDMGSMMKVLKPKIGNTFPGKDLSAMVKIYLQG